jgi:hypothetical protein
MQTNPPSRLHLLVVGVASAVFALLGAGCSVVSVSRPIGNKPHILVAADWEGIWIVDQVIGRVKVTDAAAGRLQVVSFDGQSEKPALSVSSIVITEAGGLLFANVRDADNAAKPYVWARIRHDPDRDPDQLLVWWPDVESCRELVRAGKIPGQIDGSDVRLDPLTSAQLTALVSGKFGQVFDEQTPGVLRRVARKPQ